MPVMVARHPRDVHPHPGTCSTTPFVGLWIFIFFVIGDMVIRRSPSSAPRRTKFGEGKVEKGLGWYAAMRTVQMRFLRLPKPQVKRGQYPA